MYCEYAGCICMVCLQIEGACEDCELREPGRYIQESVFKPLKEVSS